MPMSGQGNSADRTALLEIPAFESGPPQRPRRRARLAVVAVVPLVAAALALTRYGDEVDHAGSGYVPATVGPTTVVAPPATTPDVAPSTVATVATVATVKPVPKPTTTVATAPDRSRPPGMTYTPLAVWPETLAELDRLQTAVDQGQQPWRNDPVAVARAYLLDRGLPAPGMGPFQPTAADAGSVDYTVAGMGGRVDLQRLLKGSIWYVAASRTATFPGVQVSRRGERLAVVVQGGTDGTLTARAKHPGGAWGAELSQQLFTGGTRSFTVTPPPGAGEVIVQLLLHGDGKAGVAEVFLGAGTDGVSYSALDTGSRLQVDGLGPVRIGMDLEAARAASGLPMVYQEGPYCVGYRTDRPPDGIFLTSVEGSSKVDFISVSEPSIATLSGIRVGSTLAEVRRVYGDRLRGSVQDGWGKLVFRPDVPSLNQFSLAVLVSDGKVAGLWAGLRGVVEADEACS